MMPAAEEPGVYCFTLDDNIRFLEESTKRGYESIFQHPYMALFQEMHRKYVAKFQFNMYFSYEPGGFSLSQVPDRWKQELESNADWLRFSFHARHNGPPFPYETASPEELLRDYDEVMFQLKRIAGKAATDATITLHYVCATKPACQVLKSRGVRGLIGMFYPVSGRESLRYYLTDEQVGNFQTHPIWFDPDTNLTFACNDVVLNTLALEQILLELTRREKQFYHVMIHEQYFYPDYCNYQPDFAQKVEAPLIMFQQKGLRSCFLEEIL